MRNQNHGLGLVAFALFLLLGTRAFATLSAPTPGEPDVQGAASRTPTFSWTPVEGAWWYQVLIINDKDATDQFSRWVNSVNTFTLTEESALKPGCTFKWWVRAWNWVDGNGPWSAGLGFSVGQLRTMFVSLSSFAPMNSNNTRIAACEEEKLVSTYAAADHLTAGFRLPQHALLVSVQVGIESQDNTCNLGLYLHSKNIVDLTPQTWPNTINMSGFLTQGVTTVTLTDINKRIDQGIIYWMDLHFGGNTEGAFKAVHYVMIAYYE